MYWMIGGAVVLVSTTAWLSNRLHRRRMANPDYVRKMATKSGHPDPGIAYGRPRPPYDSGPAAF